MTKSYRQKLAAAHARAERAEAECLDAKIRLALTREKYQQLRGQTNRRLTERAWLVASRLSPQSEAGKLDLAAQLLADVSLISLALRHAPQKAVAVAKPRRVVVVWPGLKDKFQR
jgi:hypothetical protein